MLGTITAFGKKVHSTTSFGKKQHSSRASGFVLAEVLIYTTIIAVFAAVALVSIHSVTNEARVFDHMTRLFYYNLKRTQLISLQGRTGDVASEYNTMTVFDEQYVTNMYEPLWGKETMELPETMILKINVRRSNTIDASGYEGQDNASTLELYDKELRRGRQYIFSQQTARIRWIDVTY
ncbi:type II secretion system protein [uncultured Veillonella sp.]|uniref:type II secretion system protein n=1 Tax=uncultured Veillonella sp. TaxID=159268 RepID=UPI0025D95C70|nr:hypothetical protein [uncultured Veillonella sp.]MDY3974154.1 hypothetical protein [Veillonella caviae]